MSSESHRSHLFSLRVWRTSTKDGTQEYRGQIHHILSGEIRHFRTWDALTEFITAQVDAEDASDADGGN